MELKLLKQQTNRLLKLWLPRVLDGRWSVTTRYPLACQSDKPGSLASVTPIAGERRVTFELHRDVLWGEHEDLELTIVHELIHVLFRDTGFDDAKANMLDAVRDVCPAAVPPLERHKSATEEVTLDRIARLLIRAYGRGVEASCSI